MYSLDKLVIPLGFPLLTRHFGNWQPFTDPTYGIEVVKLWKDVLEEEKNSMDFTNETNEKRRFVPILILVNDCFYYSHISIRR